LLALRGRGFRVSAAGSGDAAPFLRAGIDYHPFHFSRFVSLRSDWAAFKAISKIIAENRPAIVQCFDTKLNVLVPLAARIHADVAVVNTINGLGWLYSSPRALALRPIHQVFQRSASRAAAVTVFQNRDDWTFFERRRMVGDGNCLIPGSGIDIRGFEQAVSKGPPPCELRKELNLGDAEVVMTVTRMTRQKGIPTLLQAAALVHRRRPGVRFVLVGPRESEGPFAVTQAEIDRHSPYVMALGRRSGIPALLGMADVFAFPTEYLEGVPRALLEAAAAGRPIVTTRMPGCSDVIRDGWNGFLVPPRAPGPLAERIVDLLSHRDNAEKMGARAAHVARKEFSLEITVDRYATVYEGLLSRSAGGRFHNGAETESGSKTQSCSQHTPQLGQDSIVAARFGPSPGVAALLPNSYRDGDP
jgi:glycosyltransferase involved in cell wall biosynthesis